MNYPNSFPYEKFLTWARLPMFGKKLNNAISIIKNAINMNKRWYVACSAGKDSMVIAHLVNSLSPGIEIWSEKDDCDFPGEREFLESTAKKYNWNIKIVSPDQSVWGAIEKTQAFDICEEIHSRTTEFSSNFFYNLIEIQEALFDGVFLGLRCQESIGRTQNFKKRGYIYQRKNSKYTCIPIAQWTGNDVFAYLVSNNVPILDVYFKTKFVDGDPTKIRKSWMLPGSRSAQGHCVWLKYYYPELFERLASIFPGVKNYV